jgi:hypothetical protein
MINDPERGWADGDRGSAVSGMLAVVRWHAAWVPAKVAAVSVNGTVKTVDLVRNHKRRVLYRRDLTGIRVDLRGQVRYADAMLRYLASPGSVSSYLQPNTYSTIEDALRAIRDAAPYVDDVMRLEQQRLRNRAYRERTRSEETRRLERLRKRAYRKANPDYCARGRVQQAVYREQKGYVVPGFST